MPSDVADVDSQPKKKDTPRAVARRHQLPLDALLAINRARYAAAHGGATLEADTPLKGAALLLRDRDNEVS